MNITIKAPKLKILDPKIENVYFAQKIKDETETCFQQIEEGFLDRKMYLVLETKNIGKDIKLKINVFQYIEEKGEVLLKSAKNTDLEVFAGNYKNDGGTATQAITEITLGFNDNQENNYFILRREKRLHLTISIDVNGDSEVDKIVRFILKDSGFWYQKNRFVLEEQKWHDPVDNPQRTKYNSHGNYKPINGAYGDVRNNYTKYHSGLDLFALPYIENEYEGTPIYASLDGIVVESVQGNTAGQTIRIKIDNVKDLLKQEKNINYQLEFSKGEEKGIDIKETDDVYFIYMHLSKRLVQKGDKVKLGDIIGYSGVSGSIANNIPSPHLHLEISTIFNPYGTGKTKRTNPARFIKLNSYNTEDQDEAVNYKYNQDGTKTKWNAPKENQTNL